MRVTLYSCNIKHHYLPGGLAHLFVVVGNVRCNIYRKQIMRADRAVEIIVRQQISVLL